MADVRVAIVSWNTAELLDRCLDSLPAALGGLEAEVVVVDNASTDGSAAVAAARTGVALIRNLVNVGYARAMNQALAGTDAPVLVALNPDTRPAPGSLRALVQALADHPAAGLVVPKLVNADGSLQHSVHRFPTVASALVVSFVPPRWKTGPIGRRWWLEGATPHDRAGPVDWAIGAVHAIRAAALEGQPPYSERWFMYVEDLDLCWRLRRDGWEVRFQPEAVVEHTGNAAGEQAWGADRAARFWAASYDFFAQARGSGPARAWAAVNTAGAVTHLVANLIGAVAGGNAGPRRRSTVSALRRVLPVHARAAVLGPGAVAGYLPEPV